jgi:hypothetical protein
MNLESVLSRSIVAQPVTPASGDTYLIPTAATGVDWAGRDGQFGIYTNAGWRFAILPIGRFLYVKDETAFYYRNTSGVWTAGVGSIALGPNSVNLSNVLGANASFVIKVENQTTNAPPVSPSPPTAYVIGPSPTGAWSGNAGKLAICLTAGSFTIIAPVAGDTVYDKAQNNSFTFNGTAWVSAAGAWISFQSIFTTDDSGVVSSGATSAYGYSDTVAPQVGFAGRIDNNTLTRSARKTGALLRFKYSGRLITNSLTTGAIGVYTLALFRDSVVNAIAWQSVTVTSPGNSAQAISFNFEAVVAAVDTSSHVYQMQALDLSASITVANLTHRLFTVEEAS